MCSFHIGGNLNLLTQLSQWQNSFTSMGAGFGSLMPMIQAHESEGLYSLSKILWPF